MNASFRYRDLRKTHKSGIDPLDPDDGEPRWELCGFAAAPIAIIAARAEAGSFGTGVQHSARFGRGQQRAMKASPIRNAPTGDQ